MIAVLIAVVTAGVLGILPLYASVHVHGIAIEDLKSEPGAIQAEFRHLHECLDERLRAVEQRLERANTALDSIQRQMKEQDR